MINVPGSATVASGNTLALTDAMGPIGRPLVVRVVLPTSVKASAVTKATVNGKTIASPVAVAANNSVTFTVRCGSGLETAGRRCKRPCCPAD